MKTKSGSFISTKSDDMKEQTSKCEACSIWTGTGHIFNGVEYRGHHLCTACKETWERWHPDWTWEHFLDPLKWERYNNLSERKLAVTQLKSQEKTLDDIATAVGVSRTTIKNDLWEIYGRTFDGVDDSISLGNVAVLDAEGEGEMTSRVSLEP